MTDTVLGADPSHGRLRLGAVILAAGAGSRIGHRPKCLLQLDGVPLIRRMLMALSGAGVDDLAVVLGHHADQIEPVLQPCSAMRVHNPSPDDGQVSSQRIGLAALGGPLDAWIIVLADQPLLEARDVLALIDAWKQRPAGTEVLQPHVAGERANPVILSAEVRRQILAAAPGFGCRQWQARHPEAVLAWPSDNRRYRVDIDSEDDLERFRQETGRRLQWPAAAV